MDYRKRIDEAVALVRDAKRIVGFTGAGVSTESGLSDFRSPGGVWDRHRIVTFQEFMASRDARIEYWSMKKEFFHELKRARPNKAHVALAELEHMKKLLCLITQNIDGLHQLAGSTNVIELHGTHRKAVCVKCAKTWPIEEVQTILESGDLDPRCDACGGYIKPATVSFGQPMPEKPTRDAFAAASSCDLLLMVGSSLQVEPAASVPREAHLAGAKLVFINRSETPYDRIAAVLFQENAGEVLDAIVRGVKGEGS